MTSTRLLLIYVDNLEYNNHICRKLKSIQNDHSINALKATYLHQFLGYFGSVWIKI